MALPKWVAAELPVNSVEAARLLGVSYRTLIDITKQHPHYERRGRKKVFYKEHILLLREAINCQNSNSKIGMARGMPLAASPVNAYEKALAQATGKSPKKQLRNTKRKSGNVIPMVIQR